MTNFLKLVGEQLRMIRKAKGLTLEQLSEMTESATSTGISKSRISDIERGQTNISLKTLEILMNALDIAPNDLFNFQKLTGVLESSEKRIMLDVQHSLLRERDLEEIKYVVRTTKDFLDTVDSKKRHYELCKKGKHL